MNLQRCLQILELETVSSPDELKMAYRDLVHVWHPDRFQSNPRLKQRAEEKLREINLAYSQLCNHLSSIQSTHSNTLTAASQGVKSCIRAANKVGTAPRKMHNTCGAQPGQFAEPANYQAPKRSSIRMAFFWGFLCLVLGFSVLIIYYWSNMDTITSKTKGMASEIIEEAVIKLEENKMIQKNDLNVRRNMQAISRKLKPKENKKSFEIHLNSGGIIITESWEEKDNMLLYKIKNGSMGIEKSRVKKIVKR